MGRKGASLKGSPKSGCNGLLRKDKIPSVQSLEHLKHPREALNQVEGLRKRACF